MKRCTWKFKLFTLLTLGVVAVACYIWVYAIAIRKDTDFRYRAAGMAELYFPSENPAITGFQFPARGDLVLEISPTPAADSSWTIIADDGSPYTTTGMYPKISLLKKEHSYTIRQNGRQDLISPVVCTVRIDYFPRELYEDYNDSLDDSYRVISSTIPVGNYQRYPLDDFVDNAYPRDDVLEAKRIIAEEIGITSADTTKAKIEKIGLFVLSRLDDKRGIPAKGLSQEAMDEYKCALDGTSRIWCVQFSRIYALFANVAGISTRFVSLGGRVDGVALSAHAFTESFISETGQWVYVDLFSRILFVSNSHGKLLNTLDLFMLQQAGVEEGLSATVFKDDRIRRVPYAEVVDDIAYYFNRDATFIFSRKKFQLLKQYRRLELAVKIVLNPDLSFSLKNSSSKHFFAVGLFYAALFFLFIQLFMFVRMFTRHR